MDDRQGTEASAAAIYFGAAVGLVVGPVLAWLDQLPVSATHMAMACVVALLVVWGLDGWVERGRLPRRLPLVGIITLVVHLLAAGGIGEPAIAGTFWILAALQMNATRYAVFHDPTGGAGAAGNERRQRPVRENRKRVTATKRRAIRSASTTASDRRGEPARTTKPFRITRRNAPFAVGLAVAGIVLAAAYFTAYAPVVRCRSHLARADATDIRRHLPRLLREAVAATAADRWSATAARRLADVRLAQWRHDRAQTSLANWSQAADSAVRLATRSARQWQANAAGWGEIWQQTKRTAHLDQAVAASRKAVARYPNDAALHGELANLLAESGDAESARVIAHTALRLDDKMRSAGHRDRFLSADSRGKMERIARNVDPKSPN